MNSLSVIQIPVGGFDKNFSYIVFDTETKHALIADPSGGIENVFKEIEERELTFAGILITHTHFDHIQKVEAALSRKRVPVYVHEEGKVSIAAEEVQAMQDGDEITLGEGKITVMYTPGHTDNSVCYYIPAEQAADGAPAVITGDTLFVSRCGKTTPQDAPTLYETLQRLKELPDETIIYAGHDYGDTPTATMAHEKANNTYLTAADYDTFYERRFN